MKSKKNVLVSLSCFIVFISILTLSGRNSGQTIQDRIAALEAWKESIEKWKPSVDEHMEELLWKDVKDILREHGEAISRLDKRGLGPPAYDSGWKAINKGEDLTLIHNLGGDPNNYIVNIHFKGSNGIHQIYYGGTYAVISEGVFWRFLNDKSIMVKRWPNDTYTDQINVRIWKY